MACPNCHVIIKRKRLDIRITTKLLSRTSMKASVGRGIFATCFDPSSATTVPITRCKHPERLCLLWELEDLWWSRLVKAAP